MPRTRVPGRSVFVTVMPSLFALGAAACGGAQPGAAPAEDVPSAKVAPVETPSLDDVLAGTHRSEPNRARDAARHPKETLAFFGLEPDMVVVELWPGRGWYTELIAPFLRARGKLSVVAPVPGTVPAVAPTVETIRVRLGEAPALFDRVEVVPVNPHAQPKFGEASSADLVVTFRNAHNWVKDDCVDDMFRAAFEVLRPGGVLGVVDHRAGPTQGIADAVAAGYLPEAFVVEIAKTAGFELDARSEINANPRDTRDHPHGVWSLPPVLRGGDADREKFLAIGESDRMTLRFVKPAKSKQKPGAAPNPSR